MSPDSTTKTLGVSGPYKRLSSTRKLVLLSIFCFANFLDVYNNAALFPAIPILEKSMGITQSQSAWIISAYQLTFASFLLISGRISDVHNPKTIFVAGLFLLGTVSLGTGFVNNKIAVILLRALTGISSAMLVPSALTLLVRVFPEPIERARAIGVFGGCGAFGNVLGLFIGALLVQYASYHWVFWFITIIAIPVALGCLFMIPREIAASRGNTSECSPKWKSLDLIGVSILTVALVLFIYAITSGSTNGWASAGVLTPLIVSILLGVGFVYWETLIPPENAAIPPRTWFYSNFSVLLGTGLYPLFWWSAIFLVYTTLWQNVFRWTVITTAVHMLPLGVAAFAASFSGALSGVFSAKWSILAGFFMLSLSTLLLAISGSRPDDYWPYTFPAFTLGGAGAILTYVHSNIAIFQVTPTSAAGTVGAMYTGALQLGSAVGLAAFTSVQTSVQDAESGNSGRVAAMWFLLGLASLEVTSVSYFYRGLGAANNQRSSEVRPNFGLGDDGEERRRAIEVSEEKSNVTEHAASDPATMKGELDKLPV